MAKVISVSLSKESIDDAIKQLKAYKSDFQYKCSLFVQRLIELGIDVIYQNRYAQGDSDFDDIEAFQDAFEANNGVVRAKLVMSGRDVAFIEFGAGIHYNGAAGSSPNPFGGDLGMTIGSFGKGQGMNDSWIYKDESNEYHVSFGTEAAMPLAKADEEIRKQALNIAKEVFK